MTKVNEVFRILITVIACATGAGGYALLKPKRAESKLAQLQSQARQRYVNFETSMKVDTYREMATRPDAQYVLSEFKKLYEKNSFKNVHIKPYPKIPTLIHIMWLGGRLPKEFEPFVQSWRNYHPSWTILFWTDNQENYDQGDTVVYSFDELRHALKTHEGMRIVIDTSGLQYKNKLFFDRARNYGEKSDILKWEIVYRFGGVYVDTDFECLQPLDLFHHTYDFYTGIQPLDTSCVQLGAALYGAIPFHPILKECVEGIGRNQHISQIISKTGPIHFTRSFLAVAGKSGLIDIAFPASYFYPCGYEQRGMVQQVWQETESYAVHHWAGSWLKPEAFVRG